MFTFRLRRERSRAAHTPGSELLRFLLCKDPTPPFPGSGADVPKLPIHSVQSFFGSFFARTRRHPFPAPARAFPYRPYTRFRVSSVPSLQRRNKTKQNKKSATFAGRADVPFCLFSLDSAGRANAFAGTAIDAGTSIDHSLVLHADCTDGAGVNTCTASNALAGNGMSHRELLISVLIDLPYRPCTAAPRYGATAGTGPAALQIVYHIV